jgi:hypothetical protein
VLWGADQPPDVLPLKAQIVILPLIVKEIIAYKTLSVKWLWRIFWAEDKFLEVSFAPVRDGDGIDPSPSPSI